LLIAAVSVSAATGCATERARGDHESSDAGTTEPAAAGPVASLDAEIARGWASAGVEVSPLADDAEFIRRVTLDLIGRVPTHDAVAEFLADPATDKRERLVDELLASPAWAERWAELWTARLVPNDRKAMRLASNVLEDWLADELERGRAWDALVTELLTAEGDAREQPAAAFLAARALRGDKRMDAVVEATATTARVFLGSRIECAQCHDHPYVSEFSREDFWAQAAYFGRAAVKLEREDGKPSGIELLERPRGELRVALDPAGEREQTIAPRYMGGDSVDADDRRAALAEHIVGDPRFAEATVGWVWTQLFGRGIVEPWDDLLSTRETPPALALLAEQFRRDEHDLRGLLRTIVLSQAYQRSSKGPHTTAAEISKAEAVFARASVRPLSAEQLFASLLTATELEAVGNRGFRQTVRQRKEAALREYELVFLDDEMASADEFSGSVSQALLLLNGGVTNHAAIARSGSALDRITASSKQLEPRIEALWLTVYARKPTPAELELARAAIGDGRLDGWEDLLFAMLYSSEFTTNH
jgi:hypothetical protein